MYFLTLKDFVIINNVFEKMSSAKFWATFFTNSSGHPVHLIDLYFDVSNGQDLNIEAISRRNWPLMITAGDGGHLPDPSIKKELSYFCRVLENLKIFCLVT
jgi:hypothetical protein